MRAVVGRYPVIAFVMLTFVISGVFVSLHLLVLRRILSPTMVFEKFAGASPSIAAVLLTAYLYRLAGLKRLAERMTPWSAGWQWLLVCLLLPLVILLGMVAVLAAAGMRVPEPNLYSWPDYLGEALFWTFFSAGLFEEVGWRGFMLPHLQKTRDALTSALIIGFVWAFWHYPGWFVFSERVPWAFIAAYIPSVMALSVVFTWVFNSTGGSVFAAMLLHGAVDASWGYVKRNLFAGIDTGGVQEDIVAGLLWSLVAAAIVIRCGTRNLSSRPRITASPDERSMAPPSDTPFVSG